MSSRGGPDLLPGATKGRAPRVCIGMPVFNCIRYVARSAQSLLNQTFEDFELLIVDNASTDGTFEFVRSLNADPRVRVVRNERNIGAIPNFIKVLSLARGEYFMWAPGDDFWEPKFVALLVKELDQHPNAGVAMSATRRIREDGKTLDVVSYHGRHDPNKLGPLRLALELGKATKLNLFINGLFRRPLLQELCRQFPDGGAPERILLAQLALAREFRYVNHILYKRQLHLIKHHERYPDEPYSRNEALGIIGDLQFVGSLSVALARSTVVPSHRKLYTPLIALSFLSTRIGGRWALAHRDSIKRSRRQMRRQRRQLWKLSRRKARRLRNILFRLPRTLGIVFRRFRMAFHQSKKRTKGMLYRLLKPLSPF